MTIHTNPSKAHGFPGDDCQSVTDTPKDAAGRVDKLQQKALDITYKRIFEARNATLNLPDIARRYSMLMGIVDDAADDIVELVNTALAAQKAELGREVLDFGSWITGKCDLHEKYTSACCGCQRESAKASLLEDYQAYIERHLTEETTVTENE
jgi:hypothetical protein